MSRERTAKSSEGAESGERVASQESATGPERVVVHERADRTERAADARESAEHEERPATPRESAVTTERPAEAPESAESKERPAGPGESAEEREQPKYKLGYPKIPSPTHHLWEAQQAGWPDHPPHFAWRDLVSHQRREDQPKASSADHPAFGAAYVPNYTATPEKPSEAYVVQREGKARR